MTDDTKNLTLQDQMAALEASDAEVVPMAQVRQLMQAVRDLFEGNFNVLDLNLYGELGELAKFINTMKKELQDFTPHELADKELPNASDQLDAIVKTTEHATQRIMDSCEKLEDIHNRFKERLLSSEIPVDPDIMMSIDSTVEEAQAYITEIFEACNFQDLTGQRIQKIVTTLREVERQVLRMIVVFGVKRKDLDADTRKSIEQEAEVLNGPALPGQGGLEQDDIDDLLSKLL